MSYLVVGNCVKCGNPIYAAFPWFSVLPPPPLRTCSCFENIGDPWDTDTDTGNANNWNVTRKLIIRSNSDGTK